MSAIGYPISREAASDRRQGSDVIRESSAGREGDRETSHPRDGESPQAVAHQLGHKTAAMVHAVYGRYVPIASDYRSGQKVGPTVASEGASKVDKTRAAG